MDNQEIERLAHAAYQHALQQNLEATHVILRVDIARGRFAGCQAGPLELIA